MALKNTFRIVFASVFMGAAGGSAFAGAFDDKLLSFVNTDGFEKINLGELDQKLLETFIAQEGIARLDKHVNALEKAVLALETSENALPRVRYSLELGQLAASDLTDAPVSFITVTRYNLGQQVYQDAIENYGAENVDTAESFGVGPHVQWRVVLKPGEEQTAEILAASRRELSDEEAQANDCAGRNCLSLIETFDDDRNWDEVDLEVLAISRYEPLGSDDLMRPTRIMSEFAIAAGFAESDGGDPIWHGIEQPEAANDIQPFLFAVIDVNLGQELMTDAIMGQTLLNDDAISELWWRRIEFSGMPVWMRSTVERKRF